MGRIRPLIEEDLPRVIDLHHRVFGNLKSYPPEVVHSFYLDIFFRHPWKDDRFPSAAYEEDAGSLAGCLGSLRRPMRMKGKAVQMAISHNFMVDPRSRSKLAAIELLRDFFEGPQDLSIAEGNPLSRKLWEGLGGTVVYPYSLSWTFALRPGRYAVGALRERGLPAVVAAALRPAAAILDASLSRLRGSPFRLAAPRLPGTDLDTRTMLERLLAFAGDHDLQPEYDAAALEWLLGLVSRRRGLGELRMRAVDGGRDGIVGWYLYFLERGGKCQVVQVAAHPGSREEVLDHLLHDAWREGAVALSGQVEPRWLPPLARRSCLFTQPGSWMLVQARDPDLVQAFQRGSAFLSRLEGEWWIRV